MSYLLTYFGKKHFFIFKKTNNKPNLSYKVAFVSRRMARANEEYAPNKNKHTPKPLLLLLLFEQGFRVAPFLLLFLHYVGAGNPSDLQEQGKSLGFCCQIDCSLNIYPLITHSLFVVIFVQQLFLQNWLVIILHRYCEV